MQPYPHLGVSPVEPIWLRICSPIFILSMSYHNLLFPTISSAFFTHFGLLGLLIFNRVCLKSSALTVHLSLYPCNSVNFCFAYFDARSWANSWLVWLFGGLFLYSQVIFRCIPSSALCPKFSLDSYWRCCTGVAEGAPCPPQSPSAAPLCAKAASLLAMGGHYLPTGQARRAGEPVSPEPALVLLCASGGSSEPRPALTLRALRGRSSSGHGAKWPITSRIGFLLFPSPYLCFLESPPKQSALGTLLPGLSTSFLLLNTVDSWVMPGWTWLYRGSVHNHGI